MVKQLFGVESLNKLLEDHQGQLVREVHLADYISKDLRKQGTLLFWMMFGPLMHGTALRLLSNIVVRMIVVW